MCKIGGPDGSWSNQNQSKLDTSGLHLVRAKPNLISGEEAWSGEEVAERLIDSNSFLCVWVEIDLKRDRHRARETGEWEPDSCDEASTWWHESQQMMIDFVNFALNLLSLAQLESFLDIGLSGPFEPFSMSWATRNLPTESSLAHPDTHRPGQDQSS